MNIRHIFFSFVCIVLLTACSSNEPTGEKIADFSFTDQNGQSFGTADLTETIWLASFIFTNCETVCPPMMFELASLQKKFAEKGVHVELISFTVDPEVDTPEVLHEYIKHYTDDESNWHIVTGYSQEEIERFAREEFETIVQKPTTSNQVIHGTNFYLVDEHGFIYDEYNYIDESYAEELVKDVERLH